MIDELKNSNNIERNIIMTKQIDIIGKYNIENRRYIGNKNKLLDWINDLIELNTKGKVFFDVFAGTGVVTNSVLDKYDSFIINDFLFSNNIIYKAFFDNQHYDRKKLLLKKKEFNLIEYNLHDDDYFVENYGNKFFSNDDARIIGEIRTLIDNDKDLNEKERNILIASLLYSSDKIANTVGHYDAYRKIKEIPNRFEFDLINPIHHDKNIKIYREDANELVRHVSSDIAFIDPPYNSRQYSRFYHVLEGITKWNKPPLSGVAMKPPVENMSDYSKVIAPKVFDDLIKNLKTNYIVVTYNNTYESKSSSSKNKITHEEILSSLNSVGDTKIFEIPFQYFNAGNTNLKDHKEFVFITEVYK